jgi:hypothetical protein
MKPEQHYADLLPESPDPALNSLVRALDQAYTAPQRPAGLSWDTASPRLTLGVQPTPSAETRSARWLTWRRSTRPRTSWPLVTAAALVLALLGAGLLISARVAKRGRVGA